jgi:hypothetical protein
MATWFIFCDRRRLPDDPGHGVTVEPFDGDMVRVRIPAVEAARWGSLLDLRLPCGCEYAYCISSKRLVRGRACGATPLPTSSSSSGASERSWPS